VEDQRERLQQFGPGRATDSVGIPERASELDLRLVQGARGQGPLARCRRMAQDGVSVGGALGVIGESGRIGRTGQLERGQRATVQCDAVDHRKILEDGHPRQLVAEGDPVGLC